MSTSAIFNNFRTLDKVPFNDGKHIFSIVIAVGDYVRSTVTGRYGVIQAIGNLDPSGRMNEDNLLDVHWFSEDHTERRSFQYHFNYDKVLYLGKSDNLKRSLYIFDNPSMEGDEEFRIKDPNNPKRKIKITKHKQVAIIARSVEHAYAIYDGYEWSRDWQLTGVQKLGPAWNDDKQPQYLTDLDWI